MVKIRTAEKPDALPVQFESIPREIRDLDRWVLWGFDKRGDGWTKVPRQPNGKLAKTNDETTWSTFEEVQDAYRDGHFDGIGIVLPDGIVGVDLDDCWIEGKGLTTEAQLISAMLPTYSERSPSGTGVKMLAFGQLNHDLVTIRHSKGVELFDGGDTNRYFCITGHVYDPEKHGRITAQREGLAGLQAIISDPIKDEDLAPTFVTDHEKVNKALDCLKHLSQRRKDERSDWLRVGAALKWCDPSEDMFQAWVEWSRDSPKFIDEDDCRKAWDSLRREEGRLFTLTHLVTMAKQDGYHPDRYQTLAISADELLQKKIHREYIIDDFLVAREPMVVGAPTKSLKTTIALDLAISIATGTPFLDHFRTLSPHNVMFISGESGEATIQETLSRIARQKDLVEADMRGLKISYKLPRLTNPEHVSSLLEELCERDIDVVFIDPLYRSLAVRDDASNVYAMGEHLELIADRIHTAGVTAILLHHFRKQGSRYNHRPELEDLSQSGIAEFTRQCLLLKRRHEYQYDGVNNMWFMWGGSAGHQGCKMLEAFTGTRQTGMTWQVNLRTEAEWEESQREQQQIERQQREDEKRHQQTELRRRMIDCLRENPGATVTDVTNMLGVHRDKISTLRDALVSEGVVTLTKRGNAKLMSLIAEEE